MQNLCQHGHLQTSQTRGTAVDVPSQSSTRSLPSRMWLLLSTMGSSVEHGNMEPVRFQGDQQQGEDPKPSRRVSVAVGPCGGQQHSHVSKLVSAARVPLHGNFPSLFRLQSRRGVTPTDAEFKLYLWQTLVSRLPVIIVGFEPVPDLIGKKAKPSKENQLRGDI